MDFSSAALAGVGGAAALSIWLLGFSLLRFPRWPTASLLGGFFSPNPVTARAIGTVLHLGVGALFGLLYVWLWSQDVGQATPLFGLLFGGIHGILATLAMPAILRIHPRPRPVPSGKGAVAILFTGYLVFGLTLSLLYLHA